MGVGNLFLLFFNRLKATAGKLPLPLAEIGNGNGIAAMKKTRRAWHRFKSIEGRSVRMLLPAGTMLNPSLQNSDVCQDQRRRRTLCLGVERINKPQNSPKISTKKRAAPFLFLSSYSSGGISRLIAMLYAAIGNIWGLTGNIWGLTGNIWGLNCSLTGNI